MSLNCEAKNKDADKWKGERRGEKKTNDIKFHTIQYVRSMNHLIKKQCNKASIWIRKNETESVHRKNKSFEPLKTKKISSRKK